MSVEGGGEISDAKAAARLDEDGNEHIAQFDAPNGPGGSNRGHGAMLMARCDSRRCRYDVGHKRYLCLSSLCLLSVSAATPQELSISRVDYSRRTAIIEHVYESPSDRESLLAQLVEVAGLRADLDLRESEILAELHELDRRSFAKARPNDLVDCLCDRTRISRTEARRKTARVGLLVDLPELLAALHEATIGASHLDVLVTAVPAKYRAALATDLPNLLREARHMSADDFAKRLRRWLSDHRRAVGEDPHESRRADRRLSMKADKGTGMTRISGLLDPESAAVARNALSEHERRFLEQDQEAASEDSEFEKRTHGQRMADAFDGVCRRSLGADEQSAHRQNPTVVVTVGLDDLDSGEGEATAEGGGPISVETARKLACEGGVVPAVLDGSGMVLNLGRKRRMATAAQRLALQVEFGGCAVPGCDAPFEWCHMHHIDYWEKGGRTDLANMVPLCSRHHSLVHAGRLELPERVRRRRRSPTPEIRETRRECFPYDPVRQPPRSVPKSQPRRRSRLA